MNGHFSDFLILFFDFGTSSHGHPACSPQEGRGGVDSAETNTRVLQEGRRGWRAHTHTRTPTHPQDPGKLVKKMTNVGSDAPRSSVGTNLGGRGGSRNPDYSLVCQIPRGVFAARGGKFHGPRSRSQPRSREAQGRAGL